MERIPRQWCLLLTTNLKFALVIKNNIPNVCYNKAKIIIAFALEKAQLSISDPPGKGILMPSKTIDSRKDIITSFRQRDVISLLESKEISMLLLNSTEEGIVSLDVDGNCTFCNSASLKLLGYEDGLELLGKSLHELIHHTRIDGTPFPKKECKACLASREGECIYTHDEIFWRKDGTSFHVEYHAYPIIKKGKLIGVVVTFLDVTDRKKMEMTLSDSEKRFHTLAEVSPVGIFHTDAKGRFLYVNERWCEITGFSYKEALHKGFASGLHPDDRESVLDSWCNTAGKDLPFKCEYRLQRTDGVITWVYSQVVAEKDTSGKVVGYVGTITDINERKLAEDMLRERNKFIESVTDNLPIGFAVTSLEDGKVLYENKKMEEIIGWPREIVNDMNSWWDHAFPDPVFRNKVKARFDVGLASGDPARMAHEFQITKCSGETAEILFVDILWDEGKKMRISAAQDITERKLAQEGILKLNQTLEARVLERTRELELANKEMEAFTYSVSHDLRAPLRAIDGFSDALLEEYGDKLDEGGKTYLRYLQEGSHEMSDLIDGLLNLSRSTRGELSVERVDFSEMANAVVKELRKSEPNRRIALSIAANIEGFADPRLLKAVMENILGNAWKYTSKCANAHVEFGAKVQEGETVYFVRDNGAGFDMAYADKLFLPFHRLHKTDEFPGIGIGLATVQRIIHHHSGRIWAQASVGEGATFFFTLGGKGSLHEK